ncbi:hypothetical protein TMatcc_000068 [Talaromyces marneffei ATCC 18224]
MFNWRTKEAYLLCLKSSGISLRANSSSSSTINEFPSSDHRMKSAYCGSSRKLDRANRQCSRRLLKGAVPVHQLVDWSSSELAGGLICGYWNVLVGGGIWHGSIWGRIDRKWLRDASSSMRILTPLKELVV